MDSIIRHSLTMLFANLDREELFLCIFNGHNNMEALESDWEQVLIAPFRSVSDSFARSNS